MSNLLRTLNIVFCSLLLWLSLGNYVCYAYSLNELLPKAPYYRIPYGKDPLQFGYLQVPKGPGPFPVAILIHGGCWVANPIYIYSMSLIADMLRKSGVATWNIEYRSIGNPGGGWPGTFQDVAQGTDFLRKIAPTYALDLSRVVVVGYSAGGHLALWLAARHKLSANSQLYTSQPLTLKGVVVLGGVPDLKAFRQQGMHTCGTDIISNLLGNAAIDEHYQETSPKELLPLGVPQILIYGSEDKAVFPQFGKTYTELALKKADPVKLIVVENAAHDYIFPYSLAWPTVKAAILSLLFPP